MRKLTITLINRPAVLLSAGCLSATSTEKGFVQGNFDQNLMTLETAEFQKHLEKFLEPLQEMTPMERAGWVAGLGHGITPQAKEANVRHFVAGIRKAFR